jgi:serine/threonine protein phosphatase PrpC
VIRVAEHFEQSDTGRQRRANEDSLYVRSPLFVVADGMGGAQAGEVASQLAVEVFSRGLPDGGTAEARLAARVAEANQAIHEVSRRDADRAGMGTTLTAAYVGEKDVAIAHVGDSRAYRWRDGALERLTDDHSLVEELMRQGKLTAEEADEHPQRSIITRALGPEPAVQVDTRTAPARDGDVFLLCSDGLTSMIGERVIAEVLADSPTLADAGRALVHAANEAGGRDNITVVLFRVEEVGGEPAAVRAGGHVEQATTTSHRAVTAEQVRSAVSVSDADADAARVESRTPRPRASAPAPRRPRRRRWGARIGGLLVLATILGAIALGTYAGITSVYFVGTDDENRIALFRGVPYELPFGIDLYRTEYRSGVPAASLPVSRRQTLLDHKLRSHKDAVDLVRELELGRLQAE